MSTIFATCAAVIISVALAGTARGASHSFLQGSSSDTNATGYTFSSQNLGTAASDRHIVVCIASRIVGTGALTSSVSVAGVSATEVVARTSQSTDRTRVGIYIAAVPTGTTGDIVVTFSGTMSRCAYSAYRLTGLSSATAYQTAESGATDPTTNLDIPAGGVAIGAGACGGNSGNTLSAGWTGLDEDFDQTIELIMRATSASRAFASAASAHAITIDFTSSGSILEPTGVFASWAPTSGSAVPAARYYREGFSSKTPREADYQKFLAVIGLGEPSLAICP